MKKYLLIFLILNLISGCMIFSPNLIKRGFYSVKKDNISEIKVRISSIKIAEKGILVKGCLSGYHYYDFKYFLRIISPKGAITEVNIDHFDIHKAHNSDSLIVSHFRVELPDKPEQGSKFQIVLQPK